MNSLRNQEGSMKNKHLVRLVVPRLGLALVLGLFAVDVRAQTSTPPAPAQQEGAQQSAPSATDKGAPPQPTTPETRSPVPQPAPNVTIENRSESRPSEGDRGRILSVDPTVAMVIGAVLLIVIVIALVAMSKRSEDVPTHRSV